MEVLPDPFLGLVDLTLLSFIAQLFPSYTFFFLHDPPNRLIPAGTSYFLGLFHSFLPALPPTPPLPSSHCTYLSLTFFLIQAFPLIHFFFFAPV